MSMCDASAVAPMIAIAASGYAPWSIRSASSCAAVSWLMAPALGRARTILRTPGTVAYAGPEPRLAHPLLVYTEMMTSTDPRTREAAADRSCPRLLRGRELARGSGQPAKQV